jgi:hypothetical protein
MNSYYSGYAIQVDATLLVNGVALTDAQLAGLTVTAALVKWDRSGLAQGTASVTCSKPGNGVVRASWTNAQTAAIAQGQYLVEFRTSDGPYCHEGIPIQILTGITA